MDSNKAGAVRLHLAVIFNLAYRATLNFLGAVRLHLAVIFNSEF